MSPWLCPVHVGALSSPRILKCGGGEGKKLGLWGWSDPGGGQLLCPQGASVVTAVWALLLGLAPVAPLAPDWARLCPTWETGVLTGG